MRWTTPGQRRAAYSPRRVARHDPRLHVGGQTDLPPRGLGDSATFPVGPRAWTAIHCGRTTAPSLIGWRTREPRVEPQPLTEVPPGWQSFVNSGGASGR